MRFLSYFITIPLTIFAIFFVASNTGDVSVSLEPFSAIYDAPLYAVGLGGLVIGFLSGALLVWMYTASIRCKKRQETKRANRLEKELERQKKELAEERAERNPKAEEDIETIQVRPNLKQIGERLT